MTLVSHTERFFEFRPIKPMQDMLRYAEGQWIPDDGEYDLAFAGVNMGFEGGTHSSFQYPCCMYVNVPYHAGILWSYCKDGNWGAIVRKHPNGNAWHYMTVDGKTWGDNFDGRDRHPNEVAGRKGMDKVCSIHHCANGDGVDFEIGDDVIKAGLLRDRATHEVVVFPKEFVCIYCGSLGNVVKP